ncbi:MAG: hypothetical protein QN141_13545 [Armatimonadota bacterium]|nr:hypothetical protein [Armatimonadota bacterium]
MPRRRLAFYVIFGVAVERCLARLHASADVDVYVNVLPADRVAVLLEDCLVPTRR